MMPHSGGHWQWWCRRSVPMHSTLFLSPADLAIPSRNPQHLANLLSMWSPLKDALSLSHPPAPHPPLEFPKSGGRALLWGWDSLGSGKAGALANWGAWDPIRILEDGVALAFTMGNLIPLAGWGYTTIPCMGEGVPFPCF